jgi:hypothetical protein
MGTMRRILAGVTGWLLAAALAVVVGLLAVSLLGTGITSGQTHPLSHAAVNRALAHATRQPSATPAPSTSTPSTPPASPTTPAPTSSDQKHAVRALGTRGGSIIARCTGNTAYLVSWSPRQGFETDDHVRGPAPTAFIKFDGEDLDVYTTISCRNGTPTAHTATQHDD